MARSRTRLAYVRNNSSRRASFRTRKFSLVKKVLEISTLCGVNASIVVYSPDDPEPDVWPSRLGAERMIHSFYNMPAFDRNQKMENQETFCKKEFEEADAMLKKLQHENRLKELSLVLKNDEDDKEWVRNQSSDYLGNLNDDVLKPLMADLERRMAMLTPGPSTPPQEN